jgi:itaconate CoA-transferase
MSRRSIDEWIDRLEAVGIPCGRVNDLEDVMGHPRLAHNGLVSEVDSPAGRTPAIGSPFLVSGERPPAGAVADLGEHTDKLLGESPSTPG